MKLSKQIRGHNGNTQQLIHRNHNNMQQTYKGAVKYLWFWLKHIKFLKIFNLNKLYILEK